MIIRDTTSHYKFYSWTRMLVVEEEEYHPKPLGVAFKRDVA